MLWRMPRKSRADARGDMLQGTLDMLILRTLLTGPAHGHTVAHVIEKGSDDILQDVFYRPSTRNRRATLMPALRLRASRSSAGYVASNVTGRG